MGSSRTTVRLFSVSSVSLVCFVTLPWCGEPQTWISLGHGYMTNAKRTYCPVDRFSPDVVRRAGHASTSGKMHVASGSDTNHRDMPWQVFHDSRYLLHDGHTRIVCNRRFQVFVAVKSNRLEKTRGRNNDFAEAIMVPLPKLLCVCLLSSTLTIYFSYLSKVHLFESCTTEISSYVRPSINLGIVFLADQYQFYYIKL